jgi:hypothetical protein
MGDYLLLSWLSTRRGLIVFILLVLMTAFSNLYRLASNRGDRNRPAVEATSNSEWRQRETNQRHRDVNGVNKDRRPQKPVKSVQPR